MNARTAKLINRAATALASRIAAGKPLHVSQVQLIRERVRRTIIRDWHLTPHNKKKSFRNRLEMETRK